jgi:hypothetical protein
MAQGTRVSGNLFHDNAGQDLFVEVDHGPFMVDNNLFLSGTSLLDMSEGGAYAHNLFAGKIINRPEPNRETPYHPAHSTTVAGLVTVKGGDDRFYNNLFLGRGEAPGGTAATKAKDPEWAGGYGLWVYDYREVPLQTGGNVFFHGARPYGKAADALVLPTLDPQIKLVHQDDCCLLQLNAGTALRQADTAPVTTARLGRAKVPGVAYENADGSPFAIDTDYFGRKRSSHQPTPGPFERPGTGLLNFRLR